MSDHEIPFIRLLNSGEKFLCVSESCLVSEIELEEREENRGVLELEACGYC